MPLSTDVLAVRHLYVRLIHHSIVQRRINFDMPQQPLHLFNRHPLVDGHRRQRAAELVRMYFM